MPFGSTIAQLQAPVIPGQQSVFQFDQGAPYDGPLPLPADPNDPLLPALDKYPGNNWASELDQYHPGNNAEAFARGDSNSLQIISALENPKVFDPVAWDVSRARRSAEADQTERALVGQRLQFDVGQAHEQFKQAQQERLANELDRPTEKRLERLANPDDPFSPLYGLKQRYDSLNQQYLDALSGKGHLSNRQQRQLSRMDSMLNQQAGRAQQMLQGAANLRQREDAARRALIEARQREQTGMPSEPLPTPDDAEQAIRWVDEAKQRAVRDKLRAQEEKKGEQAKRLDQRDLKARRSAGKQQFEDSTTAANSLAREKKAWINSEQERMDKEILGSGGRLDDAAYKERVAKWKRSPEYSQAMDAIDTAQHANELRRDAYQPPPALTPEEQAVLEEALRRQPDTPSQIVERSVRKRLGIPER